MMAKYRNKYRNESTRLQNWDYGWAASYFVTICTKDRVCYLGDVVNGTMQLSHVGVVADILWHEIKNHAQNVELGAYAVMPNHVHGIIILNESSNAVGTTPTVGKTPVVGSTHALTLRRPSKTSDTTEPKTIGQKRFQNQGKNTLSSIVGSYKSAVTRHARRLGFDFAWQSRFHDHIIRNPESYERITRYILENPVKWTNDSFHPQNSDADK